MNIFTELKEAEHSTALWFAKQYLKLYNDLPAIDALADRICPWAKLLLQTVVTAEAGAPAGALVAAGVQEAVTDLDVASAAISDAGASPSVASLLSSTQANLSGLLTAGHVKNSGSVAIVTKIVNEVGSLAQIVTAAAAPAPVAPAPAGGASAAPESSE